MGEMITFPRSISRRPVLEGGTYGQGLENEADVELYDFEADTMKAPRFDREMKNGPYARMVFKIVPAEGPTVFVERYHRTSRNSGSRLLEDLAICGVPLIEATDPETGEAAVTFDAGDVAPRKVGGIEIKAAWRGTAQDGSEIVRQGDVIKVFGKG